MTRFGVDALEHPLLAALLVALVVVAALVALRRWPSAFGWPALAEARVAGARRADPVRVAAVLLRALALGALALAIAGPVTLHRAPASAGRGLDLVLVVDASGSMRALDTEVAGQAKTRVELAREVVARFAHDRAAEGDRVGLVVFGDDAFTQCPLTNDGALLAASALRVEAGMAGEATALGDALALAVKRAIAPRDPVSAPDSPAPAPDASPRPRLEAPVAGRVVVLLTDGRSNAGSVPTDVAAALARAQGVRVHAVGIGGEGAVAMSDGGGGRVHFERHDLDAATLERIAAATGGRFFRARSSRDLAAVYEEIDTLERVPREERPRERRAPRPEPFLAAAGGLLALEIALARVLARRLP
jgi:Ca-activated chloride channel family protein